MSHIRFVERKFLKTEPEKGGIEPWLLKTCCGQFPTTISGHLNVWECNEAVQQYIADETFIAVYRIFKR